MIVYPENRAGFDRVFGRIHVNNVNPKGPGDVSKFLLLHLKFLAHFLTSIFDFLELEFFRLIPNKVSERKVSHSDIAP